MVQKVFGGQASPEPIAAGKEVYPFLLCYFPLTTSMPCWPNSYIGSRLGAQWFWWDVSFLPRPSLPCCTDRHDGRKARLTPIIRSRSQSVRLSELP